MCFCWFAFATSSLSPTSLSLSVGFHPWAPTGSLPTHRYGEALLLSAEWRNRSFCTLGPVPPTVPPAPGLCLPPDSGCNHCLLACLFLAHMPPWAGPLFALPWLPSFTLAGTGWEPHSPMPSIELVLFCQVRWHMPSLPALWRQMQVDLCEFKANLSTQ